MVDTKNRIEVLDGFRFIAILCVILFHYYSRWTYPNNSVSLYPYGSSYDYFSYGYLGVQFFFIISGFVIAFTLTKTDRFVVFWKKRFIRLFPAMLICSIITLIFTIVFDTKNIFLYSRSVTNFFYSITFISPDLLNKLLSIVHVEGWYLNGSYWSLWPEIQFYLVASVIYFINKKKFTRNVVLFILGTCLLNYLTLRVLNNSQTTNKLCLNISNSFIESYKFWIETIFTFFQNALFFLMGVLFYKIYSKTDTVFSIISLFITVLMFIFFSGGVHVSSISPVHFILLMCLIFLLFVLFPNKFDLIKFRPITCVGVSSYSLYLIHETIGVLLINKYAFYFGKFDFLFPIIIIVGMILFSVFSYKWIETPMGAFLKKKFFKV